MLEALLLILLMLDKLRPIVLGGVVIWLLVHRLRALWADSAPPIDVHTHVMHGGGAHTMAAVRALARAAWQEGYLSEEDLARLAAIGHAIPQQNGGVVELVVVEPEIQHYLPASGASKPDLPGCSPAP